MTTPTTGTGTARSAGAGLGVDEALLGPRCGVVRRPERDRRHR